MKTNRFLVVDDKEENRYLLRVLLQGHGYEVVTAAHGAEALDMARQNPPDMIISDILMPVMDGYALCRACKEDDQLKNIPFIFYTATYTDPKDEDFALSLGADRFIIKPLEPDMLLALILETKDNFEAGKRVVTYQPVEETEYYKEYNATLIRKLEGKMLQLEEANRILELDITQHKWAEELIRIRLSLLEFAVSCSLEELLRNTVDEVCALTNSPIGFFHFVESDQKTLSLQAWSTRTTKEFCKAEGKGLHYSIDQAGVWADCARERRPVIHNDYSALPHRKGMTEGHAVIVRELVVPIMRSGRILAILGVGNKSADYTKDDVEIVSYLADVAWEITERKRAEDTLRESEHKYRRLYESIRDAIGFVDMSGKIVETNQVFLDMLGYSPEELKHLTYLDITPFKWHDMEARIGAEEIIPFGHSCVYEKEYIRKDGRVLPVELRTFLIRNEEGKPAGVWALIRDISERKQAENERVQVEAQLRQAQKMEALGTLAGGIAHDFNNILGIIMGFTEIAKLELGENSSIRGKLDEVLKAAGRAKELVKQILAFSRSSEQRKIPVQLGLIVKEALKILRPSLPSTIEIKTDVLSKAAALADPTQMHQVLMNLCTNAAHAMQDKGGVLEVRLTDVLLEGESLPSHAGLKPGPYVELTVKDTGCGIDPAIINAIFDPFFTTKELGEGTGLGLAVVHGIVKSHEGKIDVESEPGKGTIFTVVIPVLRSGSAPQKDKARIPLPRGQERVLVVDDEPRLAEVLQQMLKSLGYDAVSRTSGTEALEVIYHQRPEKRFDLLITDMTMPHFTGADLARELCRVQPMVPIILMTGFSSTMDAEKARELGIQGFLMKPVVLDQLAGIVRAVLDRKVK